MTSTVVVTAHCPSDIEVVTGISIDKHHDGLIEALQEEMTEVRVLQDGQSHSVAIYEGRIAVAFERKKQT